MTRSAILLTAVCCVTGITGCGYMLGSPSYEHVRTVHVPVFQTDSFRRNLDYLLTEAVHREIKTRGAYRLTDEASADTILRGRIIDIRKNPLSETRFDDARELQLLVGVEISWIDRRNGQILMQQTLQLDPSLIHAAGQASFAPEVGQSLATAQQEAATRLAAQIADLMEMPW
ncbi:MAG: LptE family protein [Planctomycetaceae bacterium]|nr:LptE family protein [Planctomycetaceae bacterium]